jgi:hypothetical protein
MPTLLSLLRNLSKTSQSTYHEECRNAGINPISCFPAFLPSSSSPVWVLDQRFCRWLFRYSVFSVHLLSISVQGSGIRPRCGFGGLTETMRTEKRGINIQGFGREQNAISGPRALHHTQALWAGFAFGMQLVAAKQGLIPHSGGIGRFVLRSHAMQPFFFEYFSLAV